MRVELENDLFSNSPSPSQLFTLVGLALEGRHRIFVRDDREANFVAWLSALPREQRIEWDLCLEAAYQLEAREPAGRVLLVTAGANEDWSAVPPSVPLASAVNHLQRPFTALLEDSESDRAFLLAVASPEQRSFILQMEKLNALEFEHGGGISNMPKRLAKLLESAGGSIRVWSAFDGDGLQPGTHSADAERLSNACTAAGVPFHRLQRRAIENYIPDVCLHSWAWYPHNADRKKLVRAFRRMSSDQRSHYNMKNGFTRDSKRNDASAGTLYDGVSPQDVETLSAGFGEDISRLFVKADVPQSEWQSEGSWDELNALVTSLVKLIR